MALRRSDVAKVVKDWKDGKLSNEYVTQSIQQISNYKLWFNNPTSKDLTENSIVCVDGVGFENQNYEDAYNAYLDSKVYLHVKEATAEDDERFQIRIPKTIEARTCIMATDWSIFVASVMLDENFDRTDKENWRAARYIAPSGSYVGATPTYITTKSKQAEFDILGLSKEPKKSSAPKTVLALMKESGGSKVGGVVLATVNATTTIAATKTLAVKIGDEVKTVKSPLSSVGDVFEVGKAVLIAQKEDSDDWLVVNAEC